MNDIPNPAQPSIVVGPDPRLLSAEGRQAARLIIEAHQLGCFENVNDLRLGEFIKEQFSAYWTAVDHAEDAAIWGPGSPLGLIVDDPDTLVDHERAALIAWFQDACDWNRSEALAHRAGPIAEAHAFVSAAAAATWTILKGSEQRAATSRAAIAHLDPDDAKNL